MRSIRSHTVKPYPVVASITSVILGTQLGELLWRYFANTLYVGRPSISMILSVITVCLIAQAVSLWMRKSGREIFFIQILTANVGYFAFVALLSFFIRALAQIQKSTPFDMGTWCLLASSVVGFGMCYLTIKFLLGK
jgi:hypothetical protein